MYVCWGPYSSHPPVSPSSSNHTHATPDLTHVFCSSHPKIIIEAKRQKNNGTVLKVGNFSWIYICNYIIINWFIFVIWWQEVENQLTRTWDGYVDWRGKPTLRSKHGGMRPAFFVLGNYFTEILSKCRGIRFLTRFFMKQQSYIYFFHYFMWPEYVAEEYVLRL